jgi:L-cysteine desulfidase
MTLVLANLSGMLCDGAKESCSLKVGTGASEAYFAAEFAMAGERLAPQGLVGETIEETITNVALVSNDGMKIVDRLIIGVLDERHRPESVF